MSTGSKLVSLRQPKPTPNSVWGTEQLPKSLILDEKATAVLVAAAEAAAVIEIFGRESQHPG